MPGPENRGSTFLQLAVGDPGYGFRNKQSTIGRKALQDRFIESDRGNAATGTYKSGCHIFLLTLGFATETLQTAFAICTFCTVAADGDLPQLEDFA